MKNWYIKLMVNDGKGNLYNPCGMDYNMLYDDLKTLRGVINRIKKWTPFSKMILEVEGLEIYTYTNLYDDDTHKLQLKLNKDDALFKEILRSQLDM